jgi:antibiotic biosynthesis monooxygenase (ABM) superfamily enzyme
MEPNPADSSVTWVVNHHVRPDRVDQFEEWLRGIKEEVGRFPGWRGVTVLRPASPAGATSEYVLVVRFGALEDLARWEHSTERAQWLRQLEPLVIAGPTAVSASGLETWFQLAPSGAVVPPPKWKMAVLVLAAIFPLVVVVTVSLGTVGSRYVGLPVSFGAEYLIRTLLTAIALVILMTWVAMPRLTRLMRRWLYPM